MDYLSVGRAADIDNSLERFLYRILETLPGVLVWATFSAAVILSWLKPFWMAVFIVAFALYWLYKVLYFAIHTRAAYRRMRQHEKTDWMAKLRELSSSSSYELQTTSYEDIWHLVIIPMYKEPYEVIRPAVTALAASDWPKERMIVVLGTEEAAGEEALQTAERLRDEFADTFGHFAITIHPQGLPGEIPGKGSNESWAAREIKKNYIDPRGLPYEQIIVSALDSDTVVYPKYFACLAYHYLTAEHPLRSSYQPIPLFLNNIWQAPALSRVMAFSATFWHTMNQERPEKLFTFSSHAMPFKTLVEVGFWQTNVVAEDTQIFWQCFLYFKGDYRVVSLYYPLSMDANVTPSFWRTLKNVYKQQRRWAYGITDVPYFIYGFFKSPTRLPWNKFLHHLFYRWEGLYSWATHAVLLFALGWLPIIIGGDEFNQTLFSYNLPRITRLLLTLAMVGLVASAYMALQILPPRPPHYGRWKYLFMVLQWLLIPITLIIFGAFPAIEAQTRLMLGKYLGFWPTEKFRRNM